MTGGVSDSWSSGAGNNVNSGNTTSAGLVAVNDVADVSALNSGSGDGLNVRSPNVTVGGLVAVNDAVDVSALNGSNGDGSGAGITSIVAITHRPA